MSNNSSTTNPKKPTQNQRWWKFHILQAGLYFIFACLLCLLLCGVFLLISLPFRQSSTSADPAPQAAASSLTEQAESVRESPAPSEEPVPEATTISLIAFGDNLIHDTIYQYAWQADGTYDFTEIYTPLKDEIADADIACIQQETILVSDPSLYSNYPTFGTPSDLADSLAGIGFDVICHASNHTYDQGMTGINDSLEKWASYPDIAVLGIHASQEAADQIAVVEREGIRVALLDYTYGLNYSYPDTDYTIDLADSDHRDRIASQISSARSQSDIVVVFLHMGDEDDTEPNAEQKEWAQFFADAGVGLVIGTSSHSVQPADVIEGKDGNQMPIVYSLGNFLSSQKQAINLVGAMADVKITKSGGQTYVSSLNTQPVVTWIQSGSGKPGYGYIFHTLHLEDYTDEMGAQHIRSACMPDDMWAVWNNVYGDAEEITLTPDTASSDTAPADTEPVLTPPPAADTTAASPEPAASDVSSTDPDSPKSPAASAQPVSGGTASETEPENTLPVFGTTAG